MSVWIVIATVAVVAIIVTLGRGSHSSDLPRHDVDALEVLRRRFANGEISEEEFDRRRTRLEHGPRTS